MRPFSIPTRLDKVSWDLHFFKEKTDHEVGRCEFFWECQEKGFFDIPQNWCRDITLYQDTRECMCRPEWYLKDMKEETA